MQAKRQILILGNSHIVSFERQFKKQAEQLPNPPAIHVAMNNFLVKPWRETHEHDNLHFLKFQEGFGTPMDLSAHRGMIDLVIVGSGILGSGLLTMRSFIETVPKSDEANASNYTPRVPKLLWTKLKAEPTHTAFPIHPWIMRLIYAYLWRLRTSVLKTLLASGEFRSINWVVEPDMIEDCARVRFGDGLVDSGLYSLHRELATRVFESMVSRNGWANIFVTHPDDHRTVTGFTKSEFAASISTTDVHTSMAFYEDSISTILQRLPK